MKTVFFMPISEIFLCSNSREQEIAQILFFNERTSEPGEQVSLDFEGLKKSVLLIIIRLSKKKKLC
jgi:hypothetical protein